MPNPERPPLPAVALTANPANEAEPATSGKSYLITSVLYLISQSFGFVLGSLTFLLGLMTVIFLAILTDSPLLASLLIALLAGGAAVTSVLAGAGAFRLLTRRLEEKEIDPWPARLFIVVVVAIYLTLLLVLITVLLIMIAAIEPVKYPIALAGLGLVAILASQIYLPGRIAGPIARVSSGSAKALSLVALVTLALAATSFTGGAAILAVSGQEQLESEEQSSQTRARGEEIARQQLLGASQAGQNFLIDRNTKKTRANLAQYLCRADYKINGREQSCVFLSVAPLPELRSASKKIFIGSVNQNTVELCLRGGNRFFCTLTGPGAVWRGWSSFGFENARAGSEENLGWPSGKLSQEESELEQTINDILGQVENNRR